MSDYQPETPLPCAAGRVGRRLGRRASLAVIVMWLLQAAAVPAFAVGNGAGLVDGRMCVRPATGNDSGTESGNGRDGACGPVEIALQSGNRAAVRISDIVYRLQLNSDRIDIVLMHGTMQIDGFSASYDWRGKTLHFADPEKGVRYEIDFDPRAPRAAR